jgi:hypothetical protein
MRVSFCGGAGVRFAELRIYQAERTDTSVCFRLIVLMYQDPFREKFGNLHFCAVFGGSCRHDRSYALISNKVVGS